MSRVVASRSVVSFRWDGTLGRLVTTALIRLSLIGMSLLVLGLVMACAGGGGLAVVMAAKRRG